MAQLKEESSFVEEIDFAEVTTVEVVGRGSFGVVWRAEWRQRPVAVKIIESDSEKRAFAVEKKQLSRVRHDNIIRLYGASTVRPVCLVMEFAEGGSLYNLLHSRPHRQYSAGHAISWALQCARGVAYLHSLQPKVIHRDLKPPNLLLVDRGGTRLKICDFGTARDLTTCGHLTNNQGSAAWMAPEVFEGSSYTEKCDVFSWGIILWEVLTRRRPFDNIKGTTVAILWAVHTGQRPPLISNCPPPLEALMTGCWEKESSERPSMQDVVDKMEKLAVHFPGGDVPITEYEDQSSEVEEEDEEDEEDEGTIETFGPQTTTSLNGTISSVLSTQMAALSVEVTEPEPTPESKPHPFARLEALTASRPTTLLTPPKRPQVRQSNINNDQWEVGDEISPVEEVKSIPAVASLPPAAPRAKEQQPSGSESEELDNVYQMLDPKLQPLPPDPDNPDSLRVFNEHKQLAQEYFRVQTEMAYTRQYRDHLAEKLSEEQLQQPSQQLEELAKLESEKENLEQLQRNLRRQLELIRRARGAPPDWVVVPRT
ncbi:mitogen-activated protein kinase kinase kinase 7-like isoform X2 [Neocloeon triangulifer]|uniref:mitogen-activated protein kinase kinase kinase 7-like isoform X2 n=1 Tax=Neocloeon triangulifer TaxID=2078957 RepID=UPI00286EF8DF|nr:mitogen-activated protein kinase kinase kinase 7-like isoform X2 [Neocloeon triangulifer]